MNAWRDMELEEKIERESDRVGKERETKEAVGEMFSRLKGLENGLFTPELAEREIVAAAGGRRMSMMVMMMVMVRS